MVASSMAGSSNTVRSGSTSKADLTSVGDSTSIPESTLIGGIFVRVLGSESFVFVSGAISSTAGSSLIGFSATSSSKIGS